MIYEFAGVMPSDAKAKRQAAKAAKQQAAREKAGAVAAKDDAASIASTETAMSKATIKDNGAPAFFERTGKNAQARKSMNMDINQNEC